MCATMLCLQPLSTPSQSEASLSLQQGQELKDKYPNPPIALQIFKDGHPNRVTTLQFVALYFIGHAIK